MGETSAIQWTEATWNPLVGCSRVSEGCRHCYAERTAYRLAAMGNKNYAAVVKETKPAWNGTIGFVPSALELPLRWKKPRRIFVNSMSDLFHEKVQYEWIDEIFAVMGQCPQHVFQVLTKRPERMQRYLADFDTPLPNVWIGVSVEDQETADERIPILLNSKAAVRWVSYEPALGLASFFGPDSPTWNRDGGLDWIVVGGESGPDARPFDLAWARQTIAQCRAGGVPVFMKQLGARPWWDGIGPPPAEHVYLAPATKFNGQVGWDLDCLRDRWGGTMEEWPVDLRVREYPR